jgi:hypothetical protein
MGGNIGGLFLLVKGYFEELSQVYGVGAAKLEKYGALFLELIRPH